MMTFISLSGFSAGVSCSNFWVTDLLATSFVSAPPTKICIAFGLRYDLASCWTSRGHVAVKKSVCRFEGSSWKICKAMSGNEWQ